MHERSTSFTRRQWLKSGACGFGSNALAGLCAQQAAADRVNPLAAKPPMFTPRARRVIFIFMQGGPSHVDSFDHKPELIKRRLHPTDPEPGTEQEADAPDLEAEAETEAAAEPEAEKKEATPAPDAELAPVDAEQAEGAEPEAAREDGGSP